MSIRTRPRMTFSNFFKITLNFENEQPVIKAMRGACRLSIGR